MLYPPARRLGGLLSSRSASPIVDQHVCWLKIVFSSWKFVFKLSHPLNMSWDPGWFQWFQLGRATLRGRKLWRKQQARWRRVVACGPRSQDWVNAAEIESEGRVPFSLPILEDLLFSKLPLPGVMKAITTMTVGWVIDTDVTLQEVS